MNVRQQVAQNRETRAKALFENLDENFKTKIKELYQNELYEGFTLLEKCEVLGTTLTFKFNVNKPITNLVARMILKGEI